MAHKNAAGSTHSAIQKSSALDGQIDDGSGLKRRHYHPPARVQVSAGLNVGKVARTPFRFSERFRKFNTKKLKKFHNTLKSTKVVSVLR
jgi:hypothetical protein